jgi:protein O-mannosyl-transferase
MKNKNTPPKSAAPKVATTTSSFDWMPYIPVILAVLCFLMGINNEMTGMDDHTATTDHIAVKEFSLVKIFTEFNLGMYAPLTWLGYAIAYSVGKANAAPYHLMSLVFHAINAFLVFRLIQKLTNKAQIALWVAVIFAIHPLQVESVSWIAGFSTVLFSFFYLLACLRYLVYIDTKSVSVESNQNAAKSYLWALIFFLMACLSKTNAVTLPLTLMVLDYIRKPNMEAKKRWLGYLPFFAIALCFGLLTIYSRKTTAITLDSGIATYSLFDRIWMVGYALATYIGKLFIPIKLSVYYAFDKVNGQFSWLYYAATLLVTTLIFLSFHYKSAINWLWNGVLFYLSTIVLALPFYAVGTFELFADHYNYLGIIGGGLAIVGLFDYFKEKIPSFGRFSTGLAAFWLIGLSFLCVRQVRVWKDMLSVTTNALDLGNHFNGKMYFWRGIEYGDLNRMDLAINDFSKAIEINPDYNYEAYKFRGSLYGQQRNMDAAESDLKHYLQKDTADAVSWYNLGMLRMGKGKWSEAVVAISKTLEIKPKSTDALRSRMQAYQQMGNIEAADKDKNRLRELGSN